MMVKHATSNRALQDALAKTLRRHRARDLLRFAWAVNSALSAKGHIDEMLTG